MSAKHLPVDPPEGCQWQYVKWYAGVGALYLVESTRALRQSSVAELFYYEVPLPPSLEKPDGTPTHSIGDTCISAFGYKQITHPDQTRGVSRSLVRRFHKFARKRATEQRAAGIRRQKEADRAAFLSVSTLSG